MFGLVFILYSLFSHGISLEPLEYCSSKLDEISTLAFSKNVIPPMEGKHKGESGRIGVIGGSTEYTGAPYFAAISALKTGADLVYVITTEAAAPVIKSYSPDLIVYPYLRKLYFSKISSLIPKMDVVIIGPGLGREQSTLSLVYDIIQVCKQWMKPLVIDADGLYALSKNVSIIEQYPSPGVILTPNHAEAEHLEKSVPEASKTNDNSWYHHWGDYVSVLVKGKEDRFFSRVPAFNWQLKVGGSGRRAGGQGDILAGALGTFYNWAIRSNLCSNYHSPQLAQSLSANAAANLTRKCNEISYSYHGRSMAASDMLKVINEAFNIVMKI